MCNIIVRILHHRAPRSRWTPGTTPWRAANLATGSRITAAQAFDGKVIAVLTHHTDEVSIVPNSELFHGGGIPLSTTVRAGLHLLRIVIKSSDPE